MDINRKTDSNYYQLISALLGEDNASYKDFFIFVLIQRNLELIATYKNLAGSMEDEALKAFFSDMARLKYDDMKRFQCVYFQKDSNGLENEKHERVSSILDGELQKPEIKSLGEACRYVIHLEISNFKIYFRLLQLETDLSIKRLFVDALQMHKSNLNYISERLQYCNPEASINEYSG